MVIELSRIKFVVGLGNPGKEYEKTRHNAGFELIKLLLEKLPGSFEKFHKYNAINFRGRFRGCNLILQMPQTYMNLSGQAVAALAATEKISPSEILVAYDDVDIPLGRLRLRRGGSSGGHNGISSLIENLGSDSFGRLRLGIGEANQSKQTEHVLGYFNAEEQAVFDQVLTVGADAVICALARNLDVAMNSFNSWTLPQEEELEP
ncbi:MAG: aminoacyl-tRNA hydrolase [Victivallaceae bacterium]|nr:aminoacyl-tRNA hydrolase [Victivallaceae bacterium]MDD4180404.1 aminoacyl-tRNA hydrolase [Victivallaceae bacterium]